MSSEKPNFLTQPVVKSIFMYRNGDPYYEARRIVINEKRVSSFETLLREVTGGVQAPFGAVRNIYTPRGGHKVERLESLQSGEQYVAAGKEKFKKLDYVQIGSRKKRMMQTLPVQAKPLPHNRIKVSARFLKPIKEPCTIFVVANGDVLNPAVRLLIHQRMMGQFDKILEMITEKMGLKVLGGVRSLYTYNGHHVADGSKLECGQLYVAVGRERFKRLQYSDLLFTKPRGTRMVKGMKAYSLPPIYRFTKQSGNGKSTAQYSEDGNGEFKSSPPNDDEKSKEQLSSIVREISQSRLLKKWRSGQSFTLASSDNDEPESKANDANTDSGAPQEQKAEEKPDDDVKTTEENGEEEQEKVESASENTSEDVPASKEDSEENQETNGEEEGEKRMEEKEQNDEKERGARAANDERVEEVGEEVKEEDKQNEKEGGAKAANDERVEEVGEEVKEEDKQNEKEGGAKAVNDARVEEVGEEVKEVDKQNEKEGGAKAVNDERVEEVGEEVKEVDKQNEKEGGAKAVNDERVEEAGEEVKEEDKQNYEKEEGRKALNKERVEEVGEEVKEEVISGSKRESEGEDQGSGSANSDEILDNGKKEDGSQESSEAEKEEDKNINEDKQEEDGGEEEISNDHVNDVDASAGETEKRNDSATKESESDRSSSSSKSNEAEDERKSKEETFKDSVESKEESKVNGEVNEDKEEVKNEAEPGEKNSTKDVSVNGEKEGLVNDEYENKSKIDKD